MQLSYELQVYAFIVSQGIQLRVNENTRFKRTMGGYFFIGDDNENYEGIYRDDLKRITMYNGLPFKTYSVMCNVGKTKYVVNYHDGFKKHNDGSRLYYTCAFKNINKLNEFTLDLMKRGYVQQ